MTHLLLALACAPDTTEEKTLDLPGLMVVELRAPCDDNSAAVLDDPRLNEAVMITTLRYDYEAHALEYNSYSRWVLDLDGHLEAFCHADGDLVVQMLLRQE